MKLWGQSDWKLQDQRWYDRCSRNEMDWWAVELKNREKIVWDSINQLRDVQLAKTTLRGPNNKVKKTKITIAMRPTAKMQRIYTIGCVCRVHSRLKTLKFAVHAPLADSNSTFLAVNPSSRRCPTVSIVRRSRPIIPKSIYDYIVWRRYVL